MAADETGHWKKIAANLNLACIEPVCHAAAIESFIAGQGKEFAGTGYSWDATLDLVLHNQALLRERNIYESALVGAYTGCKTSFLAERMVGFGALLANADRQKLRGAGDPLPSQQLRVYRGTGIAEASGRVSGWSWTLSLDVACKFATAWNAEPVVLAANVADEEVYFYVVERYEEEVVCRPNAFQRMNLELKEIQSRSKSAVAELQLRNSARMSAWRPRND